MDFSFTDEQQELAALTRRILDDRVTLDRLKEVEASADGMDRDLWRELATANVTGIALAEDVGGSGYGVLELAVALAEVGRRVAPVPLLATAVTAAVLDRYGTASARGLLPGVVDGTVLLTAAVEEPAGRDPLRPATTATRTEGGWRISGRKVAVPWAPLADHLLVTAVTDAGAPAAYLVARDAAGLTVEPGRGTHRQPVGTVVLDDVAVGADAALGDAGAEPVSALVEWLLAGMCATAVGVLEEAVRITAGYISDRQQFGRPIATFQAAAAEAADAYIDATAVGVATWSAIWRLAEGRPAGDALAIAKFWVADGGQRVVRTTQHLHGGMGVDVDYPIHRYFLWAKHLELTLGSATDSLLRLGASLAAAQG